MEVAIIGAGFCGLAATWHILQHSGLKVTLIDSKGIGKGASGISAGLLHPFSGAHAKLNWRGLEGMEATKELLAVSEKALGRSVTAKSKGILRLPLSTSQESDFRQCAERYPSMTQWLNSAACQELAHGSVKVPGLWIEQGLTIYSSHYLHGLWEACASQGATFQLKWIVNLEELSEFDAVIFTTGAESVKIPELATLPIHLVKGQILELAWPENLPTLTCALNSQIYIVMTEGGKSCVVGATYEKGFWEAIPDLETAKKELLAKAYELYPPIRGAPILTCSAGMRAVTPQHRPLMQRVGTKHWILTGMGSKGLLYHALFAKELITDLVKFL